MSQRRKRGSAGPDLAVAALSRKRAELAGEIIARAAALDQLRADLAHLDAAIRIMCPDAEPEPTRPRKPSRKGCDWFGRQVPKGYRMQRYQV